MKCLQISLFNYVLPPLVSTCEGRVLRPLQTALLRWEQSFSVIPFPTNYWINTQVNHCSLSPYLCELIAFLNPLFWRCWICLGLMAHKQSILSSRHFILTPIVHRRVCQAEQRQCDSVFAHIITFSYKCFRHISTELS